MTEMHHWGWTVAQSNGSWTTIDPTPIGVFHRQFFSTLEDALLYIEQRETEKVCYLITK